MKFHVPDASVVRQELTGENIYTLTINSPEIAHEAQPGQFAHLRYGNSADPLLRRPLSINDVEREKGWVVFSYQVVGKGTQLLSELKAGDMLDVIGPLGHGFETDFCGKKVGLIGGGLGIAPLIFLGRKLALQNQVQAFWGARSRELLPRLAMGENFTTGEDVDFPFSSTVVTEDGSSGRKGLVTKILLEQLAADAQGTQATQGAQDFPERFDLLFACGPKPMLVAVAQLAREYNIPLQVSLESVMACGVGACLGCTIKGKKKGEDRKTQFKVCQDGPVFWAEEVLWGE